MIAEDIPIDVAVSNNVLTGRIARTLFALDHATPSDEGADYKPLYYGLFNGISLILENTNTYDQTVAALKQLQCEAEDAYIDQSE